MKMSSSMFSPSSRSITQSITGRPATLSSGVGVRWVCGRSRVPFPASGMMTCISASPVAVFEPYQVVEVVGGRLQHVAVHHGLDLVHERRRDVRALAGPERARDEAIALLDPQDQLAGQDVHRLVLQVVVLQTQDMTSLQVQ